MTETPTAPVKKIWLRKRIWVPLLMLIVSGGLLNVPLPNATRLTDEKVSQGQYIENFLHYKKEGFHDLLCAGRASTFLAGTSDVEKSNALENKFSNMCEVDTVKEPIDSRLLALAAENETTFKLVKLGISKPCSVPDITSNFDHLAYLAVFRHVARLEVLDAKVKESSGDFAGAYQNYFDTFKLGQAVATNGVLINGLVGIAIDTIALRAMWPTIDSLSETQLQVVMGELEVASNNAVSYAAVMKQENQVMSFMMEKFSQRGYAYDVMWAMADRSKFPLIEAPRAIAGNLVWLYFIVMQHSNMAAMQEYLVKDEQFATAPYESIQERETLAYLEGDSSPIKANVYLNITAPALLRAKDAFKRRDAYYRGTYLKVARAWYNKSHSKLTNLEQLVEAGIIKSVPIDPFSGQPFKLVDGKIYSIGHDRKDDLAELNVFEKSEGGKNNPANYGDMVF